MRIAIDARELTGRPTGVGRYLREVLAAWTTLPAAAAHEYILCATEQLDTTAFKPLRVEVMTHPGVGTAWEQLRLPRLVRSAAADVLFSPGYTAPLLLGVPSIVAIHDVSFAAHPEWFTWHEGARRRFIARLAARRARRVLTISEFSRQEIVKHLGVPADRITVAYPGLTRVGSPRTDSEAGGAQSILYVGSIFSRRHVPELIGAFALLARSHPHLHLDIVGDNRTAPAADLDGIATETGVADRIHLRSYVSEEELARLYGRATAFAFLSDYEGFGLTPLEALGAGVPVVVLDTPIAREIYGTAALYVPRPEPELVASALAQLLDDGAQRQQRQQAAAGVLTRYSWSTCAERVLQALTEPT